MKKLFVIIAAAMLTTTAFAQNTAVTSSKFGDNWYAGINAGIATYPVKKEGGDGFFKSLAPEFGVRIGKNLTTVFGLALDANMYFKGNEKMFGSGQTFVNATNIDLLGTFNLSNLFGGYQGQPRGFELIALYGFGWSHMFNHLSKVNGLNSKVALDFAFNFGSDKQWQLYLEPALNYALEGWAGGYDAGGDMKYNLKNSVFELKLGVNYKFACSNGTHNFAIEKLRDQAEIDALNAQINELRNRKPEVIEKEKIVEKIVEKEGTVREVKVENLVFVTFAQGKSALTNDAKKALDEIKEGKHVQVVGTASPEGSKELNDKLSQSRADVVAEYLTARGVIVDEATGKGVQGTTSNRLAVVYVK
ncbi:MAG: OmpA family protein [Prevotella sp.]|nr:OmpA family protein [Prevotella sp.]